MKKLVLVTLISFLFFGSFGQSNQKLYYLAILKRANKYDTGDKREIPEDNPVSKDYYFDTYMAKIYIGSIAH